MEYELVIGLEVHAQLLTQSKMFCACSADYASALPNTHVCPVCLGMPGVLPTINRKAVEYTVMTALALNCSIPEASKFDRKNYPYPDLMKGYQISQYDAPLSHDGWLDIETDGQVKRKGIIRVHLEEDTAKLVHRTSEAGESCSLVDANRAGVPLMEIVGQPDLRFPEEARQYLIKLRTILRYLGVSTGNMEEGSFRCDANISIRPAGSDVLMPKVEVKNMNSFKAVFQALEYEAGRQKKLVGDGGRTVQETRGWDDQRGVTVSQRSKEQAHDYRYFPEPDLPPLLLRSGWVSDLRDRLPELPDAMRQRLVEQYGLSSYDARLLTSSKALAVFFEECLSADGPGRPIEELRRRAKSVANWLNGDFSRLLNAAGLEIDSQKVTSRQLTEFVSLMDKGAITGPAAKQVFDEMFATGRNAAEIIAEKGLALLDNVDEVKRIVGEVIAANTQAVVDLKAGKQQILTFLVGQVMRASRGRASPQQVKEFLQEELGVK
ncbi:MAG: Asp-tRNA(Asn)/Glu-tRNA(Gln) amidotransferase subunit GatB [Dehalococcoidia bacterium]|nr:Asp-tRNA(Asn)/Glu-tRNA(Gln) amidotransferase subunit GatB [Dehalococcoidia bacterium]